MTASTENHQALLHDVDETDCEYRSRSTKLLYPRRTVLQFCIVLQTGRMKQQQILLNGWKTWNIWNKQKWVPILFDTFYSLISSVDLCFFFFFSFFSEGNDKICSSCSCKRCNLPFIFIPWRAPLRKSNRMISNFEKYCILTYEQFDHHICEVSLRHLA